MLDVGGIRSEEHVGHGARRGEQHPADQEGDKRVAVDQEHRGAPATAHQRLQRHCPGT